MNVGFIGFGNMARAIAGGLRKNSNCRLVAVEPDENNRRIAASMGALVFPDAGDARATLSNADIVVLAVKPQILNAAVAALAPAPDILYLSIAAGVRTAELQAWLAPARRIVRAMPNTPALIHAGIAGLYAAPDILAQDRATASALLHSVGATHWFDDEAMLDAVTAISGSGPAYVFYFIEALEEAAQGLGFDAPTARRFAIATFAGASRLAAESDLSPASLRASVTSKGGTTAEALALIEASHVKTIIDRAVRAATRRARELGDETRRSREMPPC